MIAGLGTPPHPNPPPEGEGAVVLTIDLDAIAANWRLLSGLHPSGPVAAVLKADAYGLGAGRVAPRLHREGCRHFFVAHLAEAIPLRPLLPDSMIAVLNGLWPGHAPLYQQHDITPVLGSLPEIDDWAARAPALLHVDTGMNRLGLGASDLDRLDPARLPPLLYVMTHLVSAERPDDAVNQQQAARFAAACARLPNAPRSLANSSGIFLGLGSDLARPGAALFGVNPTPGQPNPMQGVVRLMARIIGLRTIQPGETVGYNGQWTAMRPSRIATVSVGYADGYPRVLSNRAMACFDGQTVPLVGRVSMDLTTFDVTDVPGAGLGAWLELMGPNVPADQIADWAGTNCYEILTQLSRRYRRTYLGA